MPGSGRRCVMGPCNASDAALVGWPNPPRGQACAGPVHGAATSGSWCLAHLVSWRRPAALGAQRVTRGGSLSSCDSDRKIDQFLSGGHPGFPGKSVDQLCPPRPHSALGASWLSLSRLGFQAHHLLYSSAYFLCAL